jgi:hypothetical protein
MTLIYGTAVTSSIRVTVEIDGDDDGRRFQHIQETQEEELNQERFQHAGDDHAECDGGLP